MCGQHGAWRVELQRDAEEGSVVAGEMPGSVDKEHNRSAGGAVVSSPMAMVQGLALSVSSASGAAAEPAAAGEWRLVAAIRNLVRFHNHRLAAATP
jgi:hypothetical protein